MNRKRCECCRINDVGKVLGERHERKLVYGIRATFWRVRIIDATRSVLSDNSRELETKNKNIFKVNTKGDDGKISNLSECIAN